jgi:hypothetical protein
MHYAKIKEGTNTVSVHQQGGSNSSQSVPSGTNVPQPTQKSNPSQQKNSDSGKEFNDLRIMN